MLTIGIVNDYWFITIILGELLVGSRYLVSDGFNVRVLAEDSVISGKKGARGTVSPTTASTGASLLLTLFPEKSITWRRMANHTWAKCGAACHRTQEPALHGIPVR